MWSTIETQVRDRIGFLTLNRPHVRNAMDSVMVSEVAQAVREFDADENVRTIVIAGSPPSFCSGIDLSQPFPGDLRTLYRSSLADREAPALCRKPTLAAVSGAAFGAGCELALMCDMIVADTTARFSLPEVKRDTMPGVGGTQRLARLVGRARALEICLTGRPVEAEEAFRIGLAVKLVEPAALKGAVESLAGQIAAAAADAAMMIKQSINAVEEMSLSNGLQLERNLSQMSLAIRAATEDDR